MKRKNLITEELSRIQKIMYGKTIINENFLGSLTRQAVTNSIRASIESVMDDFVKNAIRLGTKEATEKAAGVIDDIIKQGTKGAMSVASTANKVYDDVARKAFNMSYRQLDEAGRLSVINQVRTALTDIEDDVIKSAKNAYDDLGKKTGKVADDAGKLSDDAAKAADDAAKGGITRTGKKWFDATTKFAKKHWGKLLIGGAILAAFTAWLSGDESDTGIPECLKNGLSEEDFTNYTENGYIVAKNTGNPAIDGGKFYSEGRKFESTDGTEGTWESGTDEIVITINGEGIVITCAGVTPLPNPTPAPEPVNGKCPSYDECSGTYKQCCKSDVIKKVQGCLGGLKTDGLYGPKTKSALNSAGYPDGFKDSDVDKICGVTTAPKPEEEPIELPTADDNIDSLNK
jgi:hypothetical protein